MAQAMVVSSRRDDGSAGVAPVATTLSWTSTFEPREYRVRESTRESAEPGAAAVRLATSVPWPALVMVWLRPTSMTGRRYRIRAASLVLLVVSCAVGVRAEEPVATSRLVAL